MSKLVYTRIAARQIREITDWIAGESEIFAAKWVEGILALIEGPVAHDPERFGFAPEAALLEKSLRQALFGKKRGQFRILFIVLNGTVWIVQIRRAARDYMKAEEFPGLP